MIIESIQAGVTHMRAFVEVDNGVGLKCLHAGLALKADFVNQCHIQTCVFAQDPIFSYPDGGERMRSWLEEAIEMPGVEVLGSTPYVEKSEENQKRNVDWATELAIKKGLHLDFHLDYNLDPAQRPLVYHVIDTLKRQHWKERTDKVVTLGHCTRLTLFTAAEWRDLREQIGDLPISFVGLPTSDLFMMGRPHEDVGGGVRVRGTLQIPQLVQEYGLYGALGINNVGNAFTPQGSCDPLGVASLGVGVYQASTKKDAEVLFVSPNIPFDCGVILATCRFAL